MSQLHSRPVLPSRVRATATALLAASVLLGVSACGGTGAPAPTSEAASAAPTPTASQEAAEDQAAQCARLLSEVQSITTDVPRVAELLGSDPFGALALVSDLSNRVSNLDVTVTDPELLERIESIQADWDALVQDAQDSVAAGDPSALERLSGAFGDLADQVAELQQRCMGA